MVFVPGKADNSAFAFSGYEDKPDIEVHGRAQGSAVQFFHFGGFGFQLLVALFAQVKHGGHAIVPFR
jgi:hypothetical protein